MWSGLTGANATILLTGEKRSLQQDGASFKKIAPCENSVFALMNSPY
jgi:phosphate-selective porin